MVCEALKLDLLYTLSPFPIFILAQTLYGYYMPELFLSEKEQLNKMFYRLFIHTAVMEVSLSSFRYCGSKHVSPSFRNKVAYMYFPVKFSSLYSRLLCNAVDDTVLLAVTAVCCGVLEVGLRLTAFKRDYAVEKLYSRVVGANVDMIDFQQRIAYKADLLVIEMASEMSDCISIVAFFSFVCQPDGPLGTQYRPTIARKDNRERGFKIEYYLAINGFIQVAIEIFVDLVCSILEISSGIPIFRGENFTGNKMLISFAFFSMFGLFYTNAFLVQTFLFPLFQYESEIVNEKGLSEFWDARGTWIFTVPKTVEFTYFLEWQQSEVTFSDYS